MSGPNPAYSHHFRRAARAECERLAGRLEKAKAKARSRKGELAAAEADVADLKARLAALEPLLEESGVDRAGERDGLRGSSIREIAVAVLVGRGVDAGPIHYRRWLAAVEAQAGPVAGKRPEAVFLGQVTRHPLVRATTRRGFYVLDPGIIERLEARVVELRESLAAAAEVGGGGSSRSGSRSRQVLLELGRAERALAEASGALPAYAELEAR